MHVLNRRFAAFAVALSVVVVAISAPLSADPLPSDPRILSGKLDNGTSWMYRQHDNPPGKMVAMIHVRTGSLNETEEQRGLAHFMEHMMFNGSKHYPPGELLKYYESIGVEFGMDLNAGTSFDRTRYEINLPDAKPETIDRALMTLSDYAFGALLLEKEIEKERGIIMEEKRTGQDYQERIRDKLWPELFEGSRLANRLIIGIEKVIMGAQKSEFEKYYRTWYRPENITVVLVGDAKPDIVIPTIEKWFGEYRCDLPLQSQHGAEIKPFTAERAIVVTDPELARCSISLYDVRPGRAPTVETGQWRTELVEYIGSWIIGRRCEERIQRGEASYLFAGAQVFNVFDDALFVNASAGGEPAKWANMLEEIIMDLNRGLEHGFTERELGLATKEILADAERSVKTEATRNARRIAGEFTRAVQDRTPVLSAAQELELLQQMLPTVKLAEVNAAFRKHFKSGNYAYVVEMPEKEGITVPPRSDVLAAARAAWARKLEAPKEEDIPTELLAKMPTPGVIVESNTDAELKITSAWLENGVRVHHRFMDYKKDSVSVSISMAGGKIEETAQNAGITDVAQLAISQAATSRFSSTNVRDFMTGKKVGLFADGRSDDALTLVVSGSPQDLEVGLQLANAVLTDGKIEQSALDTWARNKVQSIEQGQTDLMYRAREAGADLLSGGDPRRILLTETQVKAIKLQDAQAWFDRLCREAPIEVAVVGDMRLEDAMPLIQKYVGSLAKRGRAAGHLDSLRKLARSTGPLKRQVHVNTISPQAVVMAGFIGCQGVDADDARALELASNILSTRMVKEIREEQNLVYSIGAFNAPAWIYRDSGRFLAGSMCNPENTERLASEIHKIFTDMTEKGASAQELENAKLQIANNLDSEMREPSYWMEILKHMDLHKRSVDEEKRNKQAFAAVTAEQVQRVFAKYYTPERVFSIITAPAKATESEKEDEIPAPVAEPAS